MFRTIATPGLSLYPFGLLQWLHPKSARMTNAPPHVPILERGVLNVNLETGLEKRGTRHVLRESTSSIFLQNEAANISREEK